MDNEHSPSDRSSPEAQRANQSREVAAYNSQSSGDGSQDPKQSDEAASLKVPPLAVRRHVSAAIKWGIGIVVASLAAFLGAKVTGVLEEATSTPLKVNARWGDGCPHAVILRPPDEVARALSGVPPDDLVKQETIIREKLDGVGPGVTVLRITVQGTSSKAVVLTGFRVVVSKSAEPTGILFGYPCGDILPPRSFGVDLDTSPPKQTPLEGFDEEVNPVPATDFPYTISQSEPEVFRLYVSTQRCDCSWTVELQWVADGKAGKTIIDDNGKPFRTIATTNLPHYGFDESGQFRRLEATSLE